LFIDDPQIYFRMPIHTLAAIAGDRMSFDVNNLGRCRATGLHVISLLKAVRRTIAAIRCAPKLALLLALSGCAAIPFGVPHSRPGYPLITTGYFHLPDGATLPYRSFPADGPSHAVILALHGYDDSPDGFKLLAAYMAPRGVTIVAPDQSGFGAAPNRGHWPGTATLVNEARDMATIVHAHYPDQPLYIMGESMGAAVAILLATEPDPPPAAGYIMSSPAVWGGPALPAIARVTLDIADATVPAKRLTGRSVAVHATDNPQAVHDLGYDPLTILAPRVDSIAGLVALMGAAQAACAHLTAHSLILYGGHDELIPPDAMRLCGNALPRNGDVTFDYYPRDYHLMERDLERAKPDGDILGFIDGTGPISDAPSLGTVFLAGQ
jgi:alpha-beta hydrolase superfamily lysophospholipase